MLGCTALPLVVCASEGTIGQALSEWVDGTSTNTHHSHSNVGWHMHLLADVLQLGCCTFLQECCKLEKKRCLMSHMSKKASTFPYSTNVWSIATMTEGILVSGQVFSVKLGRKFGLQILVSVRYHLFSSFKLSC